METKPGIFTTELWLTLVINFIMFLNMIEVWTLVPDKWAGIIMAVVSGLYTISRGWAKSGVQADPTVPANYKLLPTRADHRSRR